MEIIIVIIAVIVVEIFLVFHEIWFIDILTKTSSLIILG